MNKLNILFTNEYENLEEICCAKMEVDEGGIAKYLEKNREGIHHICYEVDDVAAELEKLKAAGVPLINNEPVPGAHNMLVAFVHPKGANGVLTELAQHGH